MVPINTSKINDSIMKYWIPYKNENRTDLRNNNISTKSIYNSTYKELIFRKIPSVNQNHQLMRTISSTN